MKRVYKVSYGDSVCYSTRLVDVFRFLRKLFSKDCVIACFTVDFQVTNLD